MNTIYSDGAVEGFTDRQPVITKKQSFNHMDPCKAGWVPGKSLDFNSIDLFANYVWDESSSICGPRHQENLKGHYKIVKRVTSGCKWMSIMQNEDFLN